MSAEHCGRYCGNHSLWQSLVTGVLPTVLVTIWQTCVLPYAFYWCACRPRAEVL